MKVQSINKEKGINKQTSFAGPLDQAFTTALMTIDTNPMMNAVLIDTGAMVIPRTYVDSKKRNKYAGAETFFREATGTIIVCLSSGIVAKGIAAIINKTVNKSININPNMWINDESFDLFKNIWLKSEKNIDSFIKTVFSNISGRDGKKNNAWKEIQWENVEWFEKDSWKNIKWEDSKFKNIHNSLISEEKITSTMSEIIKNKNIHKKDLKNILQILEIRITNALKVSSSINISFENQTINSSVKNLIRDLHDSGKEIFNNTKINLNEAEAKLKFINKTKTIGAISLVAGLGLVNQYINRLITKKRTGSDDFVGNSDFGKKKTTDKPQNKSLLNTYKFLASAGIVSLLMIVMNVKNPRDFIKKLEFDGVITSGNVIKTIYTATLTGRFIAAKDKNELRESVTRDYLGFLNWLVFGGFVAKGVAQLAFDKKQNTLFNIKKEGKGVGHWLKDVSLKTHAEIASQGKDFAKKNIWKLNVAHTAGLLYSGLALGFALPLLNIFITKSLEKRKSQKINTSKIKT